MWDFTNFTECKYTKTKSTRSILTSWIGIFPWKEFGKT